MNVRDLAQGESSLSHIVTAYQIVLKVKAIICVSLGAFSPNSQAPGQLNLGPGPSIPS